MAETTETQQIVERVVSEVLQGQLTQMREALVRRVVAELPAQASTGIPAGEAASLVKAVAAIQAGNTQREILRALLDNMAHYSGRAALFVIKSGAANGWQSRGFGKGDEDPIKDFALDVTTSLAGRALQSRSILSGSAGEMDGQFISRFGAPADGQGLVLPLVLKEKVAALVYADAGPSAGGKGKMDTAALELLVLSASAWLEVTSLRKQAHKEAPAGAAEKAETAAAVQHASSFSDPFASHSPKHAAAAAAGAESSVSTVIPAVAPSEEAHAAPGHASEPSPEDAEAHQKAQRFARLLVDEIKLYNRAKVEEGRKHKDLYDRLKEDIEKSRATYQKRYGNTAAASGDYFTHELVRSLAEEDPSIMGASFRR